jgi:hypothetical protein
MTGGPCPHPPRPCLLALCPPGVRVPAWHRGERPTRSRWPLHAWEPVLYHGGRQQVTGRCRADSLVCGAGPLATLPGRVIGAKPAAVCRWIFTVLGAAPGDTLDDLFPGSGAVSRAWAAYTGQPSYTPAVYAWWKARAEASFPAASDTSYPFRLRPHTTPAPSCPWNLPRDRPHLSGDGPVPWPGSLPDPGFWPEHCRRLNVKSGRKAISEGNAKRP